MYINSHKKRLRLYYAVPSRKPGTYITHHETASGIACFLRLPTGHMWKYGKPITRCGGIFFDRGKGSRRSAPTYRQVYIYLLTKTHRDAPA